MLSIGGVGSVTQVSRYNAEVPKRFQVDTNMADLYVGDCDSLKEELAGEDRSAESFSGYPCKPGDVFVAPGVAASSAPVKMSIDRNPRRDGRMSNSRSLFTIPGTAHGIPGLAPTHVYATPEAVRNLKLPYSEPNLYVTVQPKFAPKYVVEDIYNTASALSVTAIPNQDSNRPSQAYSQISQGMKIGALITLTLIGLSLLVVGLEQLQERRRVLAVLGAFGTKRTTLALSIFFQAAIPMVLGIALSLTIGAALGSAIVSLARVPITFNPSDTALMFGAGAIVVCFITLLSLPAITRLTRADGLRTE
jgi:hypothetical protein